jgi:hypothetical protein
MKSKSIIGAFVVIVSAFFLISATSSSAAQGGRLLVKRVANFGDRVSLSFSIDGKEVARLGEGQSYDGYLSPGRHLISATVVPNLVYSPIWRKEVSVRSGQTYSFTAIWQGQNMVLVKD